VPDPTTPLEPGSMDVHWNEGAESCASTPSAPLQVHRYDAKTFILRESLCSTYEAPFLYLLVGDTRALLIDTGDIADAKQMPLASTAADLLPQTGAAKIPLVVVHTHGHLDHRSGDAQFQQLPNVEIAATDLAHVRQYFAFADWPNDVAKVDLGNRIVDVIPTPGHYASHVSFYDRATSLLFTGDFFLPGRLIIEDTPADIASADRIVAFVRDRPVAYVLGGHIEMDANGATFPMGSQHHPNEHPLPLSKGDLLALPNVVRSFNGVYGTHGVYVMYNQTRCLEIAAASALVLLVSVVVGVRRSLRRRRARRAKTTS
jgi:hydroxyacylglutathione hydrolase